ncbi:MAG: DUF1697 domain-containing protein [Gallicola sp.]|nr:DUF1697 domain-containing protein [Gallicola sp.]
MKYILLLRGINVGGKNKVSMAALKEQLSQLDYTQIATYINSGNIVFATDKAASEIKNELDEIFKSHNEFKILYKLLSRDDFMKDYENLPSWWFEDLDRKDVLFYTDECDKEEIERNLRGAVLHNEVIHFGESAVFWGKYDEKEFLKTAYHKHLIKQSFYKQITIRNGKTYNKLYSMLEDK